MTVMPNPGDVGPVPYQWQHPRPATEFTSSPTDIQATTTAGRFWNLPMTKLYVTLAIGVLMLALAFGIVSRRYPEIILGACKICGPLVQ